jgi:hypothetical protein
MKFKYHHLLGVLIWLFFIFFVIYTRPGMSFEESFLSTFVSFFVCVVGSVITDADKPDSKAGSVLQVVVVVAVFCVSFALFYSYLEPRDFYTSLPVIADAGIITIAVFIFMRFVFPRHRGAVHSIRGAIGYGIVVFALLFYFLGMQDSAILGLLGVLCYVGHLVIDGSLKL